MKEEAKKKWGKPKLIILTRGKPEERVLMACKGGAVSVDEGTVQKNCLFAGCINCVDYQIS